MAELPEVNGVQVMMPPPEGYVVDFDNPQRNGLPAGYVLPPLGMFIAFLFFLQRLYVKTYIRNKLGWDDALLFLGWLSSIAIQSLILRSFVHGYMGVHTWEMSVETFEQFMLLSSYLNNSVYAIPSCLCRLVIMLFLLDINKTERWYRYLCYFAMFVVFGCYTSLFFAGLFGCTPIQKGYEPLFPADEGHCIDRVAMYTSNAIMGLVIDVMIISIPVPVLIKLHMSLKKKLGLLFLFSIGSATVITSAAFLAFVTETLGTDDQPWTGAPLSIVICTEANLLVICASLSTLRHFVIVTFPRWGMGTNSDRDGKSGYASRGGRTKDYALSRGGGRTKDYALSRGGGRTHELKTIGGGGSGTRGAYNDFDAPYTNMDTQVEAGRGGTIVATGPPGLGTETGVVGGPGGGVGVAVGGRNVNISSDDESSEKGIMQRTETHVYFSNANDPR